MGDESVLPRRVLVMMAKQPEAGQVKTRLAPALGLEGAADLYAAFLGDLLERFGRLPGSIERVVAVAPRGASLVDDPPWSERWRAVDQEGDGLGARMDAVFRSLAGPQRAVVMIGSDVPTLPASRIHAAFRALERGGADVVLGPDEGGGYYLVGMRRPVAGIFAVEMSTRSMFEATVERVAGAGARLATIPPWYDVDEPEDLARLRADLGRPRLGRLAPRTARRLGRSAAG